MKRLRQTGQIPAVLYGLGKDSLMLSADAKQLNKVIHLGNPVVTLSGAANEEVLIKQVQWDAFGIDVLHVDFTRLDKDQVVEITVPLELKGDSPGAKKGGDVNLLMHDIKLNCPISSIPEKLGVGIDSLDLDQSISAGDLSLPEGISLGIPAETPVVNCTPKPGSTASADESED